MPSAGSSAKHYAQVVFQIAQEQHAVDQWQGDLAAIAALASQRQAAALLKNPRFPMAAKQRVLEESLTGVNPHAMNLASLLVAKGKLELASPMVREFEKLVDVSKGIVRAQVTTALPVEAEDRKKIADQLAKATGKTVVMETRVQPEILGGMVVRLGDRIIDGSVRSNLHGLRRSLVEGEGLKT